MFSPLVTPARASREAMVTGTMLLPTRVAKLVAPVPSVTVAAAPRVPSKPVKRSFEVVVVMPLVASWTPAGRVKRTVPATRWEIAPRFSTSLRPPAGNRSMEE